MKGVTMAAEGKNERAQKYEAEWSEGFGKNHKEWPFEEGNWRKGSQQRTARRKINQRNKGKTRGQLRYHHYLKENFAWLEMQFTVIFICKIELQFTYYIKFILCIQHSDLILLYIM